MRKVILTIMDGFGYSEKEYGNAVKQANTPTIDYLKENYPNCYLEASGISVGLPKHQVGNSEVGHMNIGAGRLLEQDLIKINNRIKNKQFYKNRALVGAINNCKKNSTNLHLIGLVSDGGIHSHIDHLSAILKLCKKKRFKRVYLHAILDGRDTPETGNIVYINRILREMKKLKLGKIATISGWYYSMNRDKNYELTKTAYEAIVDGNGINFAQNVLEAFQLEEEDKSTDEFMKPTVICQNKDDVVKINDNDSIICFNYRSDRMIQLTDCFLDKNYNKFDRRCINPYYVTMTNYGIEYENVRIAFPKDALKYTLGEIISRKGLRQLRISENEKFGHITYYFNGENEAPFSREDRVLIPKKNVTTYDEYPPMSSKEITDNVLEAMDDKYSLIVINFANSDALGHTGNIQATIKGIEFLDECLKRIYEKSKEKGIDLIITADHGNAECMLNEDGTMNKSHTNNVVPFIICNKKYKLRNGKLSDIAPTILRIFKIRKPNKMKGNCLIK